MTRTITVRSYERRKPGPTAQYLAIHEALARDVETIIADQCVAALELMGAEMRFEGWSGLATGESGR